MSRLVRLFHPGQAHHVLQRGNNRQAVFFDDADRRLFLGWLNAAATAERCQLHAYVLMNNHFHLLLTADASTAIPRLLQSLGRRYVRHVNTTYGRSGTLWEGRYKSTIVDSERYVLACHRYIEENPVRAGLVLQAIDFPWSSHAHNAGSHKDAGLVPHPSYRALGATDADRQAAYAALFARPLEADTVGQFRDATQRGWVLGSDRFQQQIADTLKRRVTPPQRGRPRKAEDNNEP